MENCPPPPEETGSPSAAETGERGWGGSSDRDWLSFEEARNSLLPLSETSFGGLLTSACSETVSGLLVAGREGLAGALALILEAR